MIEDQCFGDMVGPGSVDINRGEYSEEVVDPNSRRVEIVVQGVVDEIAS